MTSDASSRFEVAEREGRVLSEALMWRHHPLIQQAEAIVAEGAIGAVREIRSAFCFVAASPADVRLSFELEGGSLMGIGCYCVNAARLFAGEPDEVGGEWRAAPSGVDMRSRSWMTFPSGASARFESALDEPDRAELEVEGETATLSIADPWHGHSTSLELIRDGEVERLARLTADPYSMEVKNVSRAIRSGDPPLLGRQDAVAQARAIEALSTAAATGRAVGLAG